MWEYSGKCAGKKLHSLHNVWKEMEKWGMMENVGENWKRKKMERAGGLEKSGVWGWKMSEKVLEKAGWAGKC